MKLKTIILIIYLTCCQSAAISQNPIDTLVNKSIEMALDDYELRLGGGFWIYGLKVYISDNHTLTLSKYLIDKYNLSIITKEKIESLLKHKGNKRNPKPFLYINIKEENGAIEILLDGINIRHKAFEFFYEIKFIYHLEEGKYKLKEMRDQTI